MRIGKLENAYQQLKEQLLRGELNEVDFKREVARLRLTDSQGTLWRLGWYTGKWYQEVEGQWIPGEPREDGGPPIMPQRAGAPGGTEYARPRGQIAPYGKDRTGWSLATTCLVSSLVTMLILSIVLLIVGVQWGWWRKQPVSEAVVAERVATESVAGAATPVESRSAPLGPSGTGTPGAPSTTVAQATASSKETAPMSQTSQPTATDTPSALAATDTVQAPTMTPTASPVATASRTETATAPPTETPIATTTRAARATEPPSLTGRLFVPAYDANPDRRTYDIHVVQLATGQREILVGQASQPALSPNASLLVYRSWDPDRRGIYVRDLASGNTWQIVGFHEAEHPSWSPDGQSIVYASQQESDRKWRLYRTWGTESDLVRRDGGDIYGRVPTWAPDGRILYWECPLGACGLYTIHPDGKNYGRITQSDKDTAPTVSPEGDRLSFMSNLSGNWEIYVTSSTPPVGQPASEPEQVTQSPSNDGLPAWSPDGRWLAFVSDREGGWAVWAMRPNGSGLRKLFELGGQPEGEVAHVPLPEQHGWTWESLAWAP